MGQAWGLSCLGQQEVQNASPVQATGGIIPPPTNQSPSPLFQSIVSNVPLGNNNGNWAVLSVWVQRVWGNCRSLSVSKKCKGGNRSGATSVRQQKCTLEGPGCSLRGRGGLKTPCNWEQTKLWWDHQQWGVPSRLQSKMEELGSTSVCPSGNCLGVRVAKPVRGACEAGVGLAGETKTVPVSNQKVGTQKLGVFKPNRVQKAKGGTKTGRQNLPFSTNQYNNK